MTAVERVARAIADAEIGYNMRLTGLVDGVSTYELTYSDGVGPLEFRTTGEVYAHVEHRRNESRARAAIEAMREADEAMVAAGSRARFYREDDGDYDAQEYRDNTKGTWEAMIDAALGGGNG